MPLISGKLPAGTCYGTPQQLLDIFSQHLSVTGTDQGILYTLTENSAPFVSDPTQPLPRLWVDFSQGSPLLYAYGGSTSKNWVMVGRQIIKETFTITDLNTPTTNKLICTLPERSYIERIGYRIDSSFTTASSVTAGAWVVTANATTTNTQSGRTLFTINPSTITSAGTTHISANPELESSSTVPLIHFPSLTQAGTSESANGRTGTFGKWSSSTPHKSTTIELWRPATPSTSNPFISGQITFWVEFTQFQS